MYSTPVCIRFNGKLLGATVKRARTTAVGLFLLQHRYPLKKEKRIDEIFIGMPVGLFIFVCILIPNNYYVRCRIRPRVAFVMT